MFDEWRWSEQAVEAERLAEQKGRGVSLINLLQRFSKPSSSTLVAKYGTTLQCDRDK